MRPRGDQKRNHLWLSTLLGRKRLGAANRGARPPLGYERCFVETQMLEADVRCWTHSGHFYHWWLLYLIQINVVAKAIP
jgi:hypothetical protein